jgi:frataxin-like iron-binding protein CyaY
LTDHEIEEVEESARVLVDTHPVDQILLMIRHFSLRIPTLSLLASSWQHYQEKFEDETHKVDLLDARQKHIELDLQLRDAAKHVMERAEDLELTEEERTVLQIIIKHQHPRRQLFWAYQTKSRYPNLSAFFADNAPIMLPVTSSGTVVKKSNHIPDDGGE